MYKTPVDYEVSPFLLLEDSCYVIYYLLSVHIILFVLQIFSVYFTLKISRNPVKVSSQVREPILYVSVYLISLVSTYAFLGCILRLGAFVVAGCFVPLDFIYIVCGKLQILTLLSTLTMLTYLWFKKENFLYGWKLLIVSYNPILFFLLLGVLASLTGLPTEAGVDFREKVLLCSSNNSAS